VPVDALLFRPGRRVGIRVPGFLWRRLAAAAARRSRKHLAWFGEDHHRVRDLAVTEIAHTAAPVTTPQIAAATGLAPERVEALLVDLEDAARCICRRDDAGVTWAYPVTSAKTPHRVRFETGERFFAASAVDAIAAPFVYSRLVGTDIIAVIGSTCACCERPLELLVTGDLEHSVLTEDAHPVLSVPVTHPSRPCDPGMDPSLRRQSVFFWSMEHAAQWGFRVRGAYPTVAQAVELTGFTQPALFGLPRSG
jgi:hypothetical protein